MNCLRCGNLDMRTNTVTTLLGYSKDDEHDHNPNCVHKVALCLRCFFRLDLERIIQRCPKEDCEWTGNTTCSICDDQHLIRSCP